MATIYLKSGAGGDGNAGTSSAAPKATLASALTAAGAGGLIYRDAAHAETQASNMTLTSPGTAASPVTIVTVNDITNIASLATGATIGVTGTNITITWAGYAYDYGCTYQGAAAGNGSNLNFNGSASFGWMFDNCTFELRTTGSATINFGHTSPADTLFDLRNCNLKFAGANNSIAGTSGKLLWSGGAIQGTSPTTVFNVGNRGFQAEIAGVDLSVASGNLVNAAMAGPNAIKFRDCRLNASVNPITGSFVGPGGMTVDCINCDSGTKNYRNERYWYQGTITTETTIVRSGGASDGTTTVSKKMVSSANAKFWSPLVAWSEPFWIDSTGSPITAVVEIVNDGSTLKDDEIWLEAEYLGSSSYPLASFGSDRKTDILATGANQSSSSVTWTTTGLTSPVKQKLEVTFTPAMKGPVYLRVCLAKASQAVYFDPAATGVITNGRSYQADGLYVNEPQAGGGGIIGGASFQGGFQS